MSARDVNPWKSCSSMTSINTGISIGDTGSSLLNDCSSASFPYSSPSRNMKEWIWTFAWIEIGWFKHNWHNGWCDFWMRYVCQMIIRTKHSSTLLPFGKERLTLAFMRSRKALYSWLSR
jgi:hypothetical protein